ncbi:MAG: hypothetical protein WEE64_13605 [Dehalococcoidia bacterium]
MRQGMRPDNEIGNDVLSRLEVRSTLLAANLLFRPTPRAGQGGRTSPNVLDPPRSGLEERSGATRFPRDAGLVQKAVQVLRVRESRRQLSIHRLAHDHRSRAKRLSKQPFRLVAVYFTGDKHIQ